MSRVVSEFIRLTGKGPVYVTSSTGASDNRFSRMAIGALRQSVPGIVFVSNRARYHSRDDWRRRWPAERERFGAGIVLTFADWNGDWYGGPTGEHVISAWAYCEILDLRRLKRPVLWYANEHPALWYFDRFTVESLPAMTSSRMARLIPNRDAEPFNPAIADADEC